MTQTLGERIVESERVRTRPGRCSKSYDRTNGEVVDDGMEKPWRDSAEIGNRDPGRHVSVKSTVGWEPSCKCGVGVVPCTVLDPYLGSGTTGAVSVRLGRRFVGVELKPDYLKLAIRRIGDEQEKMSLLHPLEPLNDKATV